jgi:hypothetical protein
MASGRLHRGDCCGRCVRTTVLVAVGTSGGVGETAWIQLERGGLFAFSAFDEVPGRTDPPDRA